jgi:hypothetical protein
LLPNLPKHQKLSIADEQYLNSFFNNIENWNSEKVHLLAVDWKIPIDVIRRYIRDNNLSTKRNCVTCHNEYITTRFTDGSCQNCIKHRQIELIGNESYKREISDCKNKILNQEQHEKDIINKNKILEDEISPLVSEIIRLRNQVIDLSIEIDNKINFEPENNNETKIIPEIIQCFVCGDSFRPTGRENKCSDDCETFYNDYKNGKGTLRVCYYCKCQFYAKEAHQHFCDIIHKESYEVTASIRKSVRDTKKEKLNTTDISISQKPSIDKKDNYNISCSCLICGKIYIPKTYNSKYCSDVCRIKFQKEDLKIVPCNICFSKENICPAHKQGWDACPQYKKGN